MKKVVEAKFLDGFRIWLRFSDGVEGVVDLADLAGKGVFSAWNDADAFSRLRVTDFGAVAWGADIDLCADALYLRITGQQPEDLFPWLRHESAHA